MYNNIKKILFIGDYAKMISFRCKDYMYSYHLLDPPKFKMHLHHYYEFLYIQKGDASYLVEGNTYEAEDGDIFITRPEELHTIIFNSPKKYERQFIQISPDFLSDIGIDLLYFINHRALGEYNRIKSDLVQKYELHYYFDKVRHYIVNRVPESDIMIKTYIIQFLVNLNSIFKEFSDDLQIYKKTNPRVDMIIKYINDNISKPIQLDELAEHFFINKYYMCHIFKEETGLTIKEFINTRRIAKAKKLLSEGYNITEICFKSGFNDYSNFYKTFKRYTGKMPKEFFK